MNDLSGRNSPQNTDAASTHRTAADLGFLRGLIASANSLLPRHNGDLGPLTPYARSIILSLLDELEAKLDAS